MTLELVPNNDLVFKGPFNVVSTTTLKLANSGNERLAYKIKTTAPKRYCVKPNSGFLEPHANTSIQVMLQPQAAGGQQDDRTKHKFMVQWVAVPSNYSDDVENFWKQDSSKLKDVQDSKLKCVFSDEQPAAVVPNDSYGQRDGDAPHSRATEPAAANLIENRVHQQQPQSNTNESTATSSIFHQRSMGAPSRDVQSQNQDRHQDTGDDSSKSRLKEENEQLKDKLKQLENTIRQRTKGTEHIDNPVVNQNKFNQQQQKGIVLFGIALSEQLVLVAFLIALLFGFSLGYFLFSCGN